MSLKCFINTLFLAHRLVLIIKIEYPHSGCTGWRGILSTKMTETSSPRIMYNNVVYDTLY